MTAIVDLIATLNAKGEITAEDTLAMRRMVWNDGAIRPEEADLIMTLNTTCRSASPEWAAFVVEALSDYIVRQALPEGYVDEANARWLMAHIDHDGRLDSLTELELLVKMIEIAASVPESLKTYALKEIETAVLTGKGPTRHGALDTSGINATEVELLRRMIFAQGGDGALVVSLAEAEMLFRLKDATLGAVNAPAWADLFVRAVGNHLMAFRAYAPLARDEQMAADAFLRDTDVKVGRFFGRMFGRGTETILPAHVVATAQHHDALVALDRAITPDEQTWLDRGLAADGQTDELEKALLRFIAEETASAA